MAKLRETCTACSLRRQKCDRQTPCNRCVRRGHPGECTKEWPAGSAPSRRDEFNRGTSSTARGESAAPRTSQDHTTAASYQPEDEGFDAQLAGTEDLATPGWFHDDVQEDSAARLSRLTGPEETPVVRQGHALDRERKQVSTESVGLRRSWKPLTRVAGDAATLEVLQLQLPSVEKIWSLVDFHELNLLWYHSSYHGPTFRHELEEAIDEGTLVLADLDLQWVALLFSLMSGALTCASSRTLGDWGFRPAEAARLSRLWYKATISCLNSAEYTMHPSLHAVNAISTLAMSAHPLGFSGELSILLGAALMIAKSLGLGSLSLDRYAETVTPASTPADRQDVLHRDVGRRAWSQLCVQDWLSLPFWESYNIHPRQFGSAKPGHRNHISMEPISETWPVYVSYGNYLFEIAKVMAEHHDAFVQSTTVFTQYEDVLDFDAKMRRLATRGMPAYFHVTEPVDPGWPQWIPWARQSLTICCSHKIIMIHRNFISRSFREANFAMTRKTCVAASKTILREARQIRPSDGPIIWIDKAFSIVAAIILCVDLYYGPESSGDYELHRTLIVDCIDMLSSFRYSVIAVKGANLLAALLRVTERRGSKRPHPDSARLRAASIGPQQIDLSSVIHALDVNITDGVVRLREEVQTPRRQSDGSDPADHPEASDSPDYRDYPELFPPQAGFCNRFLFEHLLVFGD